jgi:RNase P/RNase MRP subunit p30
MHTKKKTKKKNTYKKNIAVNGVQTQVNRMAIQSPTTNLLTHTG